MFTDDQPFLPINPFAEPITTMSTTNLNHPNGDEDMIDIDFQNANNDRASSKFYYQQNESPLKIHLNKHILNEIYRRCYER